MGHTQYNFLGTIAAGALDQLVKTGNQAFPALKAETLHARITGTQVLFQSFCGGEPFQDVLAGLGLIGRAGPHRFHALLEPALDPGVNHVHVLGTDAAAVGLAQLVDDVTEFHPLGTKIQGASLKLQVPVRVRQLVKRRIQVLHVRPLPDAQRIQLRLLVPAETVGVDHLEDADLLAVGIAGGGGGDTGATVKALVSGNVLELFADGGVGDITGLTVNARQLVEIASPLFGDGVGIGQVGFKKLLNIGQIPTL